MRIIYTDSDTNTLKNMSTAPGNDVMTVGALLIIDITSCWHEAESGIWLISYMVRVTFIATM